MKEAKNELLQFVGGVIMLVVGLYILSQKVMVSSSYGFFSLWGGRFSSGLIMVPLIIGVVWMFASGGSFVSKVFTVLSVILIIAAIVASTRIWLVTITMYEWVLILVLIFGGAGLVAKVLFANNKSEKSKKDKSEQTGGSYTSSVDDELDKMKKNMKEIAFPRTWSAGILAFMQLLINFDEIDIIRYDMRRKTEEY